MRIYGLVLCACHYSVTMHRIKHLLLFALKMSGLPKVQHFENKRIKS